MKALSRTGLWILALAAISSAVQAQTFTNSNSLLPDTYNSGGCVGFADLDGDGYDDLIVLDQSNTLHTLYQTPEGTFVDYNLGQVSNASQWGMCVADFDNDGHKDVFSGGSYDGVFVQNHCTGCAHEHGFGQRQHVHASVQLGGHRQRRCARRVWTATTMR